MIIRNVAIRHGQKVLAGPSQKSCVRDISTEVAAALAPSNILRHSIVEPKKRNTSGANPVKKYNLGRHVYKQTNSLGSVIEPYYKPHDVLLNPPKPEDVTLELLMASQAHLGHATSLWNPMNQRYIYGVRDGIHIISLEETAAHLRRAARVVEGVAYHGGLVLFVGTRKGQAGCIVKAAEMAKGCHLFERWLPGSITNGDQILSKCAIKVLDKDDRELDGYEEKLQEWKALRPDLVVLLNPMENKILLHECSLNNVPTIGIIDTDADPTWVTYPIPANDDSLRCTQVIAGVLGRAGQEGQRKRLEAAAKGEVTWFPPDGLGKPFEEDEKQKAKKQKRQEAVAEESERIEKARRRQRGEDVGEDDL